MKKHIITLGGPPGSGKSTVKRLTAERLGFKAFSTGDYSRQLAIERGMSLEEFNELVKTSKELDQMIDAELERIEKEEDNMIVDSHLAFHFVPSAFKVFLDTPLQTSAERIFNDSHSEIRRQSGDTMDSLEEAYERTRKRIENHKMRYAKHYGIDPYDSLQYDLVIDTASRTPEEIATMIIDEYTNWISS